MIQKKIKMPPKIGLRNIKTAIAVFLCIAVFALIGRNDPFFACIAAVIGMQTSVGDTLKTGKNRVIGSIIGGIAGFLAVKIFGDSALVSTFGVLILIYLNNVLKQKDAVSITVVVFLGIVMRVGEQAAFLYATNRVIDTIIGILIALAVNIVIKIPEN